MEIFPVRGLPEIDHGSDLAALIAELAPPLRDGDVVAVTQKIVSKAEGRVVSDEEGKDAWVERETRRVVARRGDLVIAETRHGFVCANAGVDASNVAAGFLSLLPEDPDGSAERIRAGLRDRTGSDVGVLITDTFGRTWRRGLVNVAIGSAGVPALLDLRGTKDAHGRILETTVVALADEIAAATGLAMGKAEGIPVAVVRGMRREGPDAPPRPAADLVRPPDEDLFRSSPLASISGRRTVRAFGPGAVPREALTEAVAAALTAPVPHGSRHRRRPWTWMVVASEPGRRALLGAMAGAWVRDLKEDGVPQDVIDRRLAKSDELLGGAPVLALPFLSLAAADDYPDERRARAERDMFVLATGAAVQNFMLALHAQGYGSAWVSSSLFCSEEAGAAVGLSPDWLAMGTVAAGPLPGDEPPPRPSIDPGDHLRFR
ncbi:MAG TPA: coenzyme F420-0:L-glutamate ligase [Actinomycetota bacterium]|nr:coenzyme F420-0:L-glutamate ligase [Actinomycetota bacterium]